MLVPVRVYQITSETLTKAVDPSVSLTQIVHQIGHALGISVKILALERADETLTVK